MKLCVTSGIIRQYSDGTPVPFDEALSFLKRAGFDEIDLDITTPLMLREDWEANFHSMVDQAVTAGIRIRYAHLPFDYPNKNSAYNWDDFYTASCRAISMAAAAGVDCAAIHPRAFMTRDYDAAAEHEAAFRFLMPYRDYAKQAGLILALENSRGPGKSALPETKRYLTEVDDLIQLADELDIGICWDTGHANISAQAQKESLLKIGKRLKMVHINDNWADDDIHTAPFLGSICWREVIEGLKAVGYSGSLNLEVSCNRLPEALRIIYAEYMASSARVLIDMMKA